ncbi:hypothetical protein MBLNU230_g4887t1 [Neophaeotheca triangularis]
MSAPNKGQEQQGKTGTGTHGHVRGGQARTSAQVSAPAPGSGSDESAGSMNPIPDRHRGSIPVETGGANSGYRASQFAFGRYGGGAERVRTRERVEEGRAAYSAAHASGRRTNQRSRVPQPPEALIRARNAFNPNAPDNSATSTTTAAPPTPTAANTTAAPPSRMAPVHYHPNTWPANKFGNDSRYTGHPLHVGESEPSQTNPFRNVHGPPLSDTPANAIGTGWIRDEVHRINAGQRSTLDYLLEASHPMAPVNGGAGGRGFGAEPSGNDGIGMRDVASSRYYREATGTTAAAQGRAARSQAGQSEGSSEEGGVDIGSGDGGNAHGNRDTRGGGPSSSGWGDKKDWRSHFDGKGKGKGA